MISNRYGASPAYSLLNTSFTGLKSNIKTSEHSHAEIKRIRYSPPCSLALKRVKNLFIKASFSVTCKKFIVVKLGAQLHTLLFQNIDLERNKITVGAECRRSFVNIVAAIYAIVKFFI